MTLMEFVEDLFFAVGIFNVFLAIYSSIAWGMCFAINHTRYRWLYLLWIIISLVICILYADITFTMPPGNILAGGSLAMIIIRPLITLILGTSALTAETMRFLRKRSNGNP